MKANSIIVAVSILIIMLLGIFASRELGWWKTKNSGAGSGKAVIGKITESHDGEEDDEQEGGSEDHKEAYYAFEVSGSTTIAQVLEMGLTEEQIISVVGEYGSENLTVKDAATTNGLSFGKVKTELNSLIND